MTLPGAVRSVLGQYATFTGRARRSELWWWVLTLNLMLTALALIQFLLGADEPYPNRMLYNMFVGLWLLLAFGALLPTLAVIVRRLHDSGRGGVWLLIVLAPFGHFVLLVFTLWDGTRGPNQYGPDPRGRVGYAPGYDAYGAGAYPLPGDGTRVPEHGPLGWSQPVPAWQQPSPGQPGPPPQPAPSWSPEHGAPAPWSVGHDPARDGAAPLEAPGFSAPWHGHEPAPPAVCRTCGLHHDPRARFCPRCGSIGTA